MWVSPCARDNGVASRSAALQQAIRLLRSSQLVSDYEEAFAEWIDEATVPNEVKLWDSVVGDGIA